MSDVNKEILEKINGLKGRVKEIVDEIQNSKKKLERAEISLKDFKEYKTKMEEELRTILQQITKTKEIHKIQPTIRGKFIEEQSAESKMIEKEISIADEANELMYYFQTDFEDNITHAKVYLSITMEAHFVIGIDYEDYPEQPKLEIPKSILDVNNENEEQFYEKIPSYINWDSDNPRRIYELVTEIETILINMYNADLDSVLKKSIEYSKKSQSLTELVKSANNALALKNYQKAIDLIYSVIDAAYDIGDQELVQKYKKNLNDVINLNKSSKGDSHFY